MNLDLDELTVDWQCPPGEIRARLIVGQDGAEQIQLRIDAGLLQMFPDDRPDGTLYHELPTALEFVRQECLAGREVADEDWAALERELGQFNYRRIALTHLAEAALEAPDSNDALGHLRRALRDIDLSLECARQLNEHCERDESDGLRATLVFNRTRLVTQIDIVEGRFEEAVESCETGAAELREALAASGMDPATANDNGGVSFLEELGRELRGHYDIELTLNERLAQAIEDEDFEAAVEIREQLARRHGEAGPDAPADDPGANRQAAQEEGAE